MNARRAMFAWPIGLAAVIAYALPAAAQDITVRGRVIERGTSEPVAGATVELSGTDRRLTNVRGEFVATLPRAGRRTLKVSMLGYRTHESNAVISADTMLVVELELEAIRLREIEVRNERFRLRGRVATANDDLPVVDAEVRVDQKEPITTSVTGRFNAGRFSTSHPVTVRVTALEFLPRTITVQSERDTTVHFAMQVDPVGQRMIQNQVDRLEIRTNAIGHSVIVYDREEILQFSGRTPWDIIRQHLRPTLRRNAPSSITLPANVPVPCLFVDERQIRETDEFMHYAPESLERIEIIDRGTMVRVYTRAYIQRMLTKRANPGPIILITGIATTCH